MQSTATERLLDQSEKLTEAVGAIRVILAKQEEHLAHHIKRTDLLEESVELLREEIKPIKLHVEMINRLCRIFTITVGTACAVIGAAAGVIRLFH